MASTVRRVLLVVLCDLGSRAVAQGPDTLERNCDPRVSHRFQACPDGYCCVRDEFMPSWVYCKKMGILHESCTTRDTETNCPCSEGLVCRPNIISQSGTASLYGKCQNEPTTTTTTTTTSTTTTATTTTTTTTAPSSTVAASAIAGSTDALTSSSSSATTGHVMTPCPHGHSCESHGHQHSTHEPHVHTHKPHEGIVG